MTTPTSPKRSGAAIGFPAGKSDSPLRKPPDDQATSAAPDAVLNPYSKRRRPTSQPSSSSDHRDYLRPQSTVGRPASIWDRWDTLYPPRRGQTSESAGSFNSNFLRTHSESAALQARQKKREDLLALHRESCRLFQASEASARSIRHDPDLSPTASPTWGSFSSAILGPGAPSRGSCTPSERDSTPNSPLLHSHPLPLLAATEEQRFLLYHDEVGIESRQKGPEARPWSSEGDADGEVYPQVHPAAIIDWTSPSTRRREYEKIDRANRGVRKLWRQVTPKWCRSGGYRTPFFEEGMDGRGNYEGSVRRFRMDIPDEKECFDAGLEKQHQVDRANERKTHSAWNRTKWLCLRS